MISAATASVAAATTATRSFRRTLLASSATAFLNNSSTHHPAYSSSATRTQSEGELKHGIEAGGSSSSTGERIKYFKVYRWDPEIENQKPYLSTYPVDLDDCGPMVRFFFPRWPFPHCGRHGPFVLLPSFWLVYLPIQFVTSSSHPSSFLLFRFHFGCCCFFFCFHTTPTGLGCVIKNQK